MGNLGLEARMERVSGEIKVKPAKKSAMKLADPDDSWSKDDIKDWFDVREIEYDGRWSKETLLEKAGEA